MLRKATCWHRRTFFATLSVTLDSSRVDPNRSISRIFSTSLAALLQASPPEEPCVQAEKLPSYSYVLEESAKRVADPDTNVNSTLLATVFARKSEEEISKEFAKRVKRYSERNDWRSMFLLVQQMIDNNFVPKRHQYLKMIRCVQLSKDPAMIWSAVRDFHEHNRLFPERQLCHTLFESLLKLGLLTDALGLLYIVQESNQQATEHFWKRLMKAHKKLEQHVQGNYVKREMERLNVKSRDLLHYAVESMTRQVIQDKIHMSTDSFSIPLPVSNQ
mmetsp:Transcript_33239/g.53891  ORF Transcript_33239/g.53891 Transcript_33239/m.53891 type:complete len:274 (+) Transcript_33239:1753-2574(+)